jgi:hypothetical protein
MGHMRKGVWLPVFLLLLSPLPAIAQEAARKNLLQGNLGLGSPVGALGLSYTYAPIRQVQIEAGGGLGFSGYQLSAMPKLVFGRAGDRLVLGIGPSLSIDTASDSKQTDVGYWMNGEIGYQHDTGSGLTVLAAVGIGYGMTGTMHSSCAENCPGNPSRSIAGDVMPELRIAIGRWF